VATRKFSLPFFEGLNRKEHAPTLFDFCSPLLCQEVLIQYRSKPQSFDLGYGSPSLPFTFLCMCLCVCVIGGDVVLNNLDLNLAALQEELNIPPGFVLQRGFVKE
jgi:hypothetical protein